MSTKRIQLLADQVIGMGILFLLAGLAAICVQGEAIGLVVMGTMGLVGGLGVRIAGGFGAAY